MEILNAIDEALENIVQITDKVVKIAVAGVIIVEAISIFTSDES